jgi:hypothetical protein
MKGTPAAFSAEVKWLARKTSTLFLLYDAAEFVLMFYSVSVLLANNFAQ